MLIIPLSIPIESKYKPRKGIVIAKDLSKLIHKGKKIMLINDTNEIIKEPLWLISDKIYGIIFLNVPREISVEEFNWLRPWHHISEEERLSKLSDKLWLYTIRYFSPIQPKPFKIQKS
jgi:hypothetical protein